MGPGQYPGFTGDGSHLGRSSSINADLILDQFFTHFLLFDLSHMGFDLSYYALICFFPTDFANDLCRGFVQTCVAFLLFFDLQCFLDFLGRGLIDFFL